MRTALPLHEPFTARSAPFARLGLLALILLVSLSTPVLASDSVLAARAVKLYQDKDAGPKDERYFIVHLLLQEILNTYPQSLTALKVHTNRFPPINVPEVKSVAREYERLNPGQATTFRNDPSLLNPNQSATRAPGPDGASSPANLSGGGRADLSPPTKFRRGQRAAIMKGATVLVVVMSSQGGALRVVDTGTGFFVNKTQVVTAAHLARKGSVFVIASAELGVGKGTLFAMGQTKDGHGIDAAVLNVQGVSPSEPLTFSSDLLQDDTILIAGYPSVIDDTDDKMAKFQSFLNGHVKPSRKAVPSLRITHTGVIEAIFERNGLNDLQYSIETMRGNSGSPVVNACAQVVGLHYKGFSASGGNSKYNFGHALPDILDFLQSHGVAVKIAERSCEQG